jgi:hypothetical protein
MSTIETKYNKYIFIILGAALVFKLIFAFAVTMELRSDSMEYDTLAKNMINLGEYAFDGKPTARLSCGYPLFIYIVYSIFGSEQLMVKIIQSFLEIFTGLLFYFVCRFYFNPKYSVFGLLIFTFLPANLLYSQTVLTESLFGLFSMFLFYYCLKEKIDWKIIFVGIIWGYSILIRTSFVLSVFLIPVFFIIYRKKIFTGYSHTRIKKIILYSLLFFAGVLLCLSPWLIRNKNVVGSYTLATQGGYTFWSGSNPEATGTWYHNIEESNPLFKNTDEVARDREFYKLGFDYAIHNPHKFFITGIKKIGYLFSSERLILLYFKTQQEGNKTSTEVYKSINPFFIALVNIPYFIILLLGLWGIFMLKEKTFFIYGFIASWIITFFLYVALSRYHYVLIPFFVIGTVKFLKDYKFELKKLSKLKIISASAFNLFLLVVWFIEFYLLYK